MWIVHDVSAVGYDDVSSSSGREPTEDVELLRQIFVECEEVFDGDGRHQPFPGTKTSWLEPRIESHDLRNVCLSGNVKKWHALEWYLQNGRYTCWQAVSSNAERVLSDRNHRIYSRRKPRPTVDRSECPAPQQRSEH